MLVEIQTSWREHEVGDIVDVNEVIAHELHTSGVGVICQNAQGEKDSSLTTKQFKLAEYNRTKAMIQFHESELKKLQDKVAKIESLIAEIATKEVKEPPKEKMLKKPVVNK